MEIACYLHPVIKTDGIMKRLMVIQGPFVPITAIGRATEPSVHVHAREHREQT